MLEYALKAASLGDDVPGWDYCTNRLEDHIATLCGKEVYPFHMATSYTYLLQAAIFVSSGTMGNQLAIRALLEKPPYRCASLRPCGLWNTDPVDSVLCDHRSHVHTSEAGGTAFHSGATSISVVPSNGAAPPSPPKSSAFQRN
jgi:threonine aldolase